MLASVKGTLDEHKRPGLLGWYGDHVPILPEAYEHFSLPAGTTPYMIWSTQTKEWSNDFMPEQHDTSH